MKRYRWHARVIPGLPVDGLYDLFAGEVLPEH